MATGDHWSSRVESWSVKVSDKLNHRGTNGSSLVRSHSGSASLRRVSAGTFRGKLTASEYEEQVQGVGGATRTTGKGSESWTAELNVSDMQYTLEIWDGSANVPAKTEALFVNVVHHHEISVPWRPANLTGPLPDKPQPISGRDADEHGATIWTLTPAGAGAKPAGPKPVPATPTPRPPSPAPDPDATLEISLLALEQFTAGGAVQPMAFCSVGSHPYLNGITPFLGRLAFRGTRGDSLTSVELQLVSGGRVRARAQLTTDMQAHFLREFPRSGTLSIGRDRGIPRWLFQLPSAETDVLATKKDSQVELRVDARTARGAVATRSYGRLPILVRVEGVPRFGVRDPTVGGDDWALPSVRDVLVDYGIQVNDIANLHGGPFAPHGTHHNGGHVDLYFPGYERFGRECAETLIGQLNDEQHGHKIVVCYVLPPAGTRRAAEFWEVVSGTVLDDGRRAASVIVPSKGHHDHYHWQIEPRATRGRRRRRQAEPQPPVTRPGRPGQPRGPAAPDPDPRRRPRGRGPTAITRARAAAVAEYAPPITAVWHSETAAEPVLHFVPECPALTRVMESDGSVAEATVAPDESDLRSIQANSDLDLCGTCRSMFEADLREGQGEGRVAVSLGPYGDALVLFSDRVELRVSEDEGGMIPLDDLQKVTPGRILLFDTPQLSFEGSEVDLHFKCSSVAERDRILDMVKRIAGPDTVLV